MVAAEIVTAAVIIGLSAHSGVVYWHTIYAKRRELVQHRLDPLAHHVDAFGPADERTGRSAAYSRYSVPVGLRLEQARRVIRDAHSDEEDSPEC